MTLMFRGNAFAVFSRGVVLLRVGGRVFCARNLRRCLPVPAVVLGNPTRRLTIGRFQFATYGGMP